VRSSFDGKQAKKIAHENVVLRVSPRRKALHDRGFKAQLKQAKKMKANATKADGVITVGDVVQIPLHASDQAKVDGKYLLAVVVEKLRSGQIRCACPTGVLHRPYAAHGVIPVQGASNNRKICGLEQAFLEWQGMARIKEREAARVVSAVGGQGHSVRCDCRGKCDSKRCKCVKEGVYCSSKCHRGNACCENHEA
jgi:hypothetical protein